jgi:hypothetical protein
MSSTASSSTKFPPPLEEEANPARPVIPPLPKPKRQRVDLTPQTILSRLGRVEEDIISLKMNTTKGPLHPLEAVSRLDDLALIAIRTRTLTEGSLAIMETDLLLADLDSMHQMVRYHSTRFSNKEAMKIRLKKLKVAQDKAREKATMLNNFKQSRERINTLITEREMEYRSESEGSDREDGAYTLRHVKNEDEHRGRQDTPYATRYTT